MKNRLLAFTALSLVTVLLFTGCGKAAPSSNSTQKPNTQIVATSGQTSQGTPIVDTAKSEFTLADANMHDTPDSSCFSEIGYSEDYEILVVTFRDSGSTYIYTDFTKADWKSFSNADSLGSYYNANIKGQFSGYKY